MRWVAPYWKAITGFLAPGAVLIITATTDGSLGGSTITQNEWITALAVCVATAGGVYAAPYRSRESPTGT